MNYGAYRSCAITYYFQKLVTSTMYNKNIVWLEADSYCTRVNFFTRYYLHKFQNCLELFYKISKYKISAHEKYDISNYSNLSSFLKLLNHFQHYTHFTNEYLFHLTHTFKRLQQIHTLNSRKEIWTGPKKPLTLKKRPFTRDPLLNLFLRDRKLVQEECSPLKTSN